MTTIYTARWVLPVTADAVEDGAVAVDGAEIVGVGVRDELTAKFPGARVSDFGAAAIVPGFVNCHTHLELTAMRGYLEPEERDFFAWLKKLTTARMFKMTPDDLYVSAAWGAVEAARAGVTCVGDASDAGASSLAALRDAGLRATVFQEVFGPDPDFAREQLAGLRDKVERLRQTENALVRAGVSPHAPYTVSAPLLELVTEYALAENLPVMMHVAESAAETLFMREGRGAFAESFARRGIAWHAPGISSVQYLERLGALRTRPLLAHCITVDDADIATLHERGARVAHCPKSNAKFGHGRAPLTALLARGVAVGFGSDSVASNNTCDLLEEARFAALLARIDDTAAVATDTATAATFAIDAARALDIATRGGAHALGLETTTGALEVGLQADLAVVALDGAHQLPIHDPATALVFASAARDVRLTVVAGREIYRDGRVLTLDEEQLRARLTELAARLATP